MDSTYSCIRYTIYIQLLLYKISTVHTFEEDINNLWLDRLYIVHVAGYDIHSAYKWIRYLQYTTWLDKI